jgi:hypothetical protein
VVQVLEMDLSAKGVHWTAAFLTAQPRATPAASQHVERPAETETYEDHLHDINMTNG